MRRLPATARLLFALLPFVLPLAAEANIIHVPNDYPTIAFAVHFAAPGDTVLIACNTYYENLIYVDKPLIIVSESGDPACVTIDGSGTGRILVVQDTYDVAITGITFTHGLADVGAAVAVDSSDAMISDCVFTENVATLEGAGIRWREGTPTITDCTFTHNTAAYSGGGMVLNYNEGAVTGCYFMGNDAQWGGGACTDTDCDPTFTGCIWDLNSAELGGGLYVWDAPDGTIDACSFTYNSADVGGAALFEQTDIVFITDTYFGENTATYAGGALCFEASAARPSFCSFARNEATWGGAIAIEASSGTQLISNCTMVMNGAPTSRTTGGGIAVRDGSTVELIQSIIAFSESGEAVAVEPGSEVTLTTCDLHGNPGGDWVGDIASQLPLSFNMDVDPRLCGVHEDDWTLCSNSDCLPDNNDANLLVGRYGQGCGECTTPVSAVSWGVLKAMYR